MKTFKEYEGALNEGASDIKVSNDLKVEVNKDGSITLVQKGKDTKREMLLKWILT